MLVYVTRVPRPNVEERLELAGAATVIHVLRRLQAPPDSVVVLRGDAPLPVDAALSDGDRIRVVGVFSGG